MYPHANSHGEHGSTTPHPHTDDPSVPAHSLNDEESEDENLNF